jgi:hypothetical protein
MRKAAQPGDGPVRHFITGGTRAWNTPFDAAPFDVVHGRYRVSCGATIPAGSGGVRVDLLICSNQPVMLRMTVPVGAGAGEAADGYFSGVLDDAGRGNLRCWPWH